MRSLPLLGLALIASLQLTAQKRWLVGGIVGLSNSSLDNMDNAKVNSGSGWYAGAQMDYQLTSRLSFNAQLQFQSEEYKKFWYSRVYSNAQFNTKRLLAGLTEYLPIGNHAGYINLMFSLSNYTARGIENGSTARSNVFEVNDFRPWHLGTGLQLGYVFRFGLSMQTGYMVDFTRIANKPQYASLRYQQFQLLQLGFMPGFNKRDRMNTWNKRKRRRS